MSSIESRCPLELREPNPYTDYEYDTGVPLECRSCLVDALADASVAKTVEYMDPTKYARDSIDIDNDEQWRVIGIRDEGGHKRAGVEEIGLDVLGTNDEYILSRVTAVFDCYLY